jgi:membrane protein required for colicin V production
LHLFDLFLLAVIAWSTLRAFLRGFLRELFSLAGLILGIVLAGIYYQRVAILLSRWITSIPAAHITAFLGILVATIVVFGLIGHALKKAASTVGLGFLDRSLGALFGLLRGCLFGIAIMMPVAAFFPGAAWVRQSTLAPYLLQGSHLVSLAVPHDLRQQVQDGAAAILASPPLSPDSPLPATSH